MGFWSGFMKGLTKNSTSRSNRPYKHFFVSEKKCPSCGEDLPREIKAKSICPYCQKEIFKRTLPKTQKQVNVNQDGVDAIELEWAKVNGVYDFVLAQQQEFKLMKAELSSRFGKEASRNDVLWGVYNNHILKSKNDHERSAAYLELGVICCEEKRWVDCVINYSLCGYYATRDFRNESNRLGMNYPKKYLENYHFMNTSPVTVSLSKLRKESIQSTLISYIQDKKTNPKELIDKVKKLLII